MKTGGYLKLSLLRGLRIDDGDLLAYRRCGDTSFAVVMAEAGSDYPCNVCIRFLQRYVRLLRKTGGTEDAYEIGHETNARRDELYWTGDSIPADRFR